MKYKFLPIFAAALACNLYASANESVGKNPPRRAPQGLHNWFFNANLGTQVFVGDHD